MPKNWRLAKDFIEVVNDGELVHFMDRVLQRLLIDDGTPIHCSKICKEWRQTHIFEKFK